MLKIFADANCKFLKKLSKVPDQKRWQLILDSIIACREGYSRFCNNFFMQAI